MASVGEEEIDPATVCTLQRSVVQGMEFLLPDRYILEDVIGRGAYGVVVSGMDRLTRQRVAIKKVQDVFEQPKEFQKRILRELLVLHHVRGHDCLVTLLDIAPSPSFDDFRDVYIITEYMDSDLRAIVRSSQQLTELNVQYFLYSILRAISFMHKCDILHRDLKPANILLNEDMDVKLCDFGLSRGVDLSTDPHMSTTYVATRWYRPPECLLMSDKVDGGLDMWAIGLIFAEFCFDSNSTSLPLTFHSILRLLQPPPRRPLLRGRNYMDQLDLIITFCGSPQSSEELWGCSKGVNHVFRTMSNRPGVSLSSTFPNASASALDLLSRLLTLNPSERISASEAMEHEFLSEVHSTVSSAMEESGGETDAIPFDFRMPDKVLARVSVKRLMFDFVKMWNRNVWGREVVRWNE